HPDNLHLLRQVEDGNQLDADLADWFTIQKRTLAEDARLEAAVAKHENQVRIKRLRSWASYAAAAVVIVVAGIWFLNPGKQPATRYNPLDEQLTVDMAPGGHRATLTLADGRTIDLSEAQSGIVVGDGINYFDGSTVLDIGQDDNGHIATAASPPMAISTPAGGMYRITLADGTEVWLNSESTLKYPVRFSEAERVVEIVGEA